MANAAEARRVWSPLVSVPAVRANRVHPLGGAYLVIAGPRLGDAAEAIGRALAPRSVQMKILLSWSSGKDSAWALHVLQQQHPGSVAGLLTTINEAVQRVAMHAVRRDVLEAQARAAGLPLRIVPIPDPCSNEEYEARMRVAVADAVADGFTHMAFGDLFLEDVRRYRETHLANTGLTPLFPLWQLPTPQLADGHDRRRPARAVSPAWTRAILDPTFAGREFDASLLAALPAGVDPCGENGEFHTCVYDGPMFTRAAPDRDRRDGHARAVRLARLACGRRPARAHEHAGSLSAADRLPDRGDDRNAVSARRGRPRGRRLRLHGAAARGPAQAARVGVHQRPLRQDRSAAPRPDPRLLGSPGRHRRRADQARLSGDGVQPAQRRRRSCR